MKKPSGVSHTTDTPPRGTPTVLFVLPSYKTPLLVSELLTTALESGKYAGCTFMLLLDVADTTLRLYNAMVKSLVGGGLDVGQMFFNGTTYPCMVNKLALLADFDSVCVIDGKHLPYCNEGTIVEHVKKWLSSSVEPMKLGVFGDSACYPIITPSFIDRLGYMFHPLALGRVEAERWLMRVATGIGVASSIKDVGVLESKADGAEILGVSDKDLQTWVDSTLDVYYDMEVGRLSDYVLR